MLFRNLFILFFMICAITSNAQTNDLTLLSTRNDRTSYVLVKNQNHFQSSFSALELNKSIYLKNGNHPLEKTGKILTMVGIPLAILGGVMVAGADALYYECVNGNCSGDPRGGFGVIFLGVGVGLSATGIVLWTVGKHKS